MHTDKYPGRLLLLAAIILNAFVAIAADGTNAARLREYREYPCSSDSALKLFARFECATPTGVLLVKMHGWHGGVKNPHSDSIPNPTEIGYFVVEPEMRGRGDATGNPDCSGWELQDVIDAVEFARANYRERIESPQVVLLWGGSGGGGNAFALLGKFPDYFSAANVESGMSDYALWYQFDSKGEFRDEMEGVNGKDPRGRNPWIGGSPETNPEAYRSRGGLTTVGNLLTPTLVFHGSEDIRVPPLHARLWVGAAQGQGRGALVTYHELAGVGDNRLHYANETKEQLMFRNRKDAAFLKDHRVPPVLPASSTFVVAGYLKTSRFEVILDSIDRIAFLEYDLAANQFTLKSENAKKATLRVRKESASAWQQSEIECKR